ncbi:hypothetical protein LCGC14_1205890 [marine sediment metagenome]|uniref:Uncharacterized protein n=1 Tax=marine sediment metagenome TaxID=412755 RepID=A0A0F9NXQ9_9ZZZZ
MMVEIKGTFKVDLVYHNGIPKLTKGNQYQVVMEFVSDNGNKLITFRGARLDGRLEVLLPILSGDRNQFIVSRYTPIFQDFVLKSAQKSLLEGDEKWTVQAIREMTRGR